MAEVLKPWHTADGDPEQEKLLEKHLFDEDAPKHWGVQEHDGLAPHQHKIALRRPRNA